MIRVIYFFGKRRTAPFNGTGVGTYTLSGIFASYGDSVRVAVRSGRTEEGRVRMPAVVGQGGSEGGVV